ncbi:MAG TPA: TonB-dependent receptor [Sphingobium sp.]|nr:TonB-dependent receptor [Sphingobium sp.]
MTVITSKSAKKLLCTTMLGIFALPQAGWAQETDSSGGLADIIVTAQKREQSVQDVPIAVTALNRDLLEANRVQSVQDLSGLAPGVTVRPAAGGTGIASFITRGVVTYGNVAGTDKEVSIYLDGVYISSPRGSIFDLPDVERIEMLRGPQGTLFGRNSTAGAVSISTRDPSGDPSVKADFSVGNRDYRRFRLSAEMPQVGPFSAYFSFVHLFQNGSVRNLGAGTVWDRTNSPDGTVWRSPKYLGTKDSNTWFAAVKFEPSDSFKTVYKFDYSEAENTTNASAVLGFNYAVPGLGPVLKALVESQPQPVITAFNARRPDVVNNAFSSIAPQRTEGHSLTSTWQVADNLTVKNIFGYRKNRVFAASALDGMGLVMTQAALPAYAAFARVPVANLASLVGQPFVAYGTSAGSHTKQYSDELQVNYDSSFLTLTAGAIWFKGVDVSGGLPRLQTSLVFKPIPNGKIPAGSQGIYHNKAISVAGYVQAEGHVTPQLDVVLGGRVTRDKKSGVFNVNTVPATPDVITSLPFSYRKTKPSYLIGVNYKPNDETLLYAKYSTGYVSGGSVAGIAFAEETVKSWEAGVKTDLFDRHLRVNLALFSAEYQNLQNNTSAGNFPANTFPNQATISTFIISQGGPVRAKGFELETTVAIVRGLTAGGSLSYTDTKFVRVAPALVAAAGGTRLEPTYRPKWTSNLNLQYESQPIFNDATFYLRADANWRSKMRTDGNPDRATLLPVFATSAYSPASWIVNGRAAIRDIDLGGVKAELGLWGRNLTNNRAPIFTINFNFLASANFEEARSYGVDLGIKF